MANKATGDALFETVVATFARDRQVTCEKGWSAGNLVLKVNGKIFAMLNKGRLVTKLPKARLDELVTGGIGCHFDAGRGRPMKEWVAVDEASDWVALAKEGYSFVKGRAARGRRELPVSSRGAR